MTRKRNPAAALVPNEEHEDVEETAEILSDPDSLAAIEAGLLELSRDETVELADLRRHLAERRSGAVAHDLRCPRARKARAARPRPGRSSTPSRTR